MTILRLENGALAVSANEDAANDATRNETALDLESWRAGVRPQGRAVLRLPNDADVREIGPDLHALAVVVLEFPGFADGRAYSQARILRDQLGFRGEIRAVGDVLCDQVLFMARAGFDAFDIGARDADAFHRGLDAFSYFYQAGADGSLPAWRARGRLSRAA